MAENIHNTKPWDICLDNLSVGYGERVVLSNLNACIPGGQITMILGESGCGKSTLLRHIIGLNRPIEGRILHGGEDLFALPLRHFRRIRRRFGVLFQDGALLGSLSLAENVGLPLHEHTKLDKDLLQEAVGRCLRLVGLEDFGSFFPGELSGGMKKRGGLARAIVTEPPVLFCDEPTSGLDPINAAQMDELLLQMKARYPHMSIVVVTHDMASVRKIADYVLVLREGRLVFSGTVTELEETKDAYLQGFLLRQTAEEQQSDLSAVHPDVRAALEAWLDA